jgi:pyruvate formate lyase activating enzyme
VAYLENRCTGCGTCVKVCPSGALKAIGEVADRARCTACGTCVEACLAGAREMAGRAMSASDVMSEVLKDRVFYDQSGGGVTFSGGEPLMQAEFLRELLERCREEGLATTLDTCGFAAWDVLERIVPLVDVFLYDVKMMDEGKHLQYGGASNRRILENLAGVAALASGLNKTVLARFPLIPGINDDDENIRSTGEFVRNCGLSQVSLLPYHHLGADKYRRLGREYVLPGMTPPSAESLRHAAGILEGLGLLVKAGG